MNTPIISFFTDNKLHKSLLKSLKYLFKKKYNRFSKNVPAPKNHCTHAFQFACQIYKRGILSTQSNQNSQYKISNEFIIPKIHCVDESEFESVYQKLSHESYFIIVDNFFHFIDNTHNKFYIESNEKNKNLDSIVKILKFINESKSLKKIKYIVAIGGGVTLDMAAFVASILQKKLKLIPTTLLAAVDATLGGKTGVNFEPYGKNQIGSFYFCHEIIIAPHFFNSLPRAQIISGVSEALKHSWIAGSFYEDKDIYESILTQNIAINSIDKFIIKNLKIKLKIIKADPFEQSGVRAVLNFGHTIGHALEALALSTNQKLLHGIAVAHGISFELKYYKTNHANELHYKKEFLDLLNKIIELYPIDFTQFSQDSWHQVLVQDKKNTNTTDIKLNLPPYGFLLCKDWQDIDSTYIKDLKGWTIAPDVGTRYPNTDLGDD